MHSGTAHSGVGNLGHGCGRRVERRDPSPVPRPGAGRSPRSIEVCPIRPCRRLSHNSRSLLRTSERGASESALEPVEDRGRRCFNPRAHPRTRATKRPQRSPAAPRGFNPRAHRRTRATLTPPSLPGVRPVSIHARIRGRARQALGFFDERRARVSIHARIRGRARLPR